MKAQPNWLLLQIADSAFPVGGFAHSAGLESALQSGAVNSSHESLLWFCSESINQTAFAILPFVNETFDDPSRLIATDARMDAFLSNHVAKRASLLQGRAFLSTCARAFAIPEIETLSSTAKNSGLKKHFAPLFGAISHALRFDIAEARQLFLYLSIRGVLSAAVRLNAIGPYAAQQLQVALIPQMDRVLDETSSLRAADAAQPSPLIELFQMSHDTLYSRLFQS